MKEKACANIKSAQLLSENKLYDSAASRAYYATYLIAWYYLGILGIHPPNKTKDGQYYWRHDLFPQRLCDDKIISPKEMDEWEWLYYLRIKADYYAEKIEEEEVKSSIKLSYKFLTHFINEERRLNES